MALCALTKAGDAAPGVADARYTAAAIKDVLLYDGMACAAKAERQFGREPAVLRLAVTLVAQLLPFLPAFRRVMTARYRWNPLTTVYLTAVAALCVRPLARCSALLGDAAFVARAASAFAAAFATMPPPDPLFRTPPRGLEATMGWQLCTEADGLLWQLGSSMFDDDTDYGARILSMGTLRGASAYRTLVAAVEAHPGDARVAAACCRAIAALQHRLRPGQHCLAAPAAGCIRGAAAARPHRDGGPRGARRVRGNGNACGGGARPTCAPRRLGARCCERWASDRRRLASGEAVGGGAGEEGELASPPQQPWIWRPPYAHAHSRMA